MSGTDFQFLPLAVPMKSCSVAPVLALIALVISPLLFADSAADREEFNAVYARYQALAAAGKYAEAVTPARRAYELGAVLYGAGDRNTAALAMNLGTCLGRSNQGEEAVTVLQEAVSLFEQQDGKDALTLVDPLVELGHAALQTAARGGHRKHYDRALGIIADKEGEDSLLYGDVAMEVGTQLVFRAQDRGGRRYLVRAHDIFLARAGPEDVRTGLAAFQLGKYELAAGTLGRAEPYLLEALGTFERAGGADHHLQLTAHAFLVELYDRQGKSDLATEHSVAIGRQVAFTSAEEYVPLLRPEAEYPQAALRTRQEGFVVMEFTVDEMGMVRDARAVESKGQRDFEVAALAAVTRFRYAPRFDGDQPVATSGVRHRFEFSPPKADEGRCVPTYLLTFLRPGVVAHPPWELFCVLRD